MGDVDFLGVLVRWVHISSAVVLVGGAFFIRFMLLPAAQQLSEETFQSLREAIIKRWKIVVHSVITLLFLTGIYNLVVRIGEVEPAWHMIFGVKFILAMVLFFVASALVGRSKGLQPLRDNAPKFLLINVIIAFVIILLSNLMKNLPTKPAESATGAVQPSSWVVRPVATSNSANSGTSSDKTANA